MEPMEVSNYIKFWDYIAQNNFFLNEIVDLVMYKSCLYSSTFSKDPSNN